VRRLEIHIGELLLNGFPSGERYRIAESLANELGRLFSQQHIPAAIQPREEIRAGSIHVGRGDVGEQVARAVYGGLADG
jgi:hypothetical protein